MEEINAINIPFYSFQADNSLVEEIKQVVEKLNYEAENDLTNGYVSPKFYNEKIFNFFNASINQVKNIYYKNDIEFPIVDCWVNKYTTMNKLNKHNHRNSVICGLYYVTSHDDYAQTVFNARSPWNFMSIDGLNLTIHKEEFPTLSGKITATEGKLILFPANLYHYMNTISKNFTVRYTIAFNTFPSGIISDWKSSRLQIKTNGTN